MMKYIIVIIAVIITSIEVNSQRSTSEFIMVLNKDEVNLDSHEKSILQNIMSNEMYSQVTLVRVGNLAAIQTEGMLAFTLPNHSKFIYAKAKIVETVSENEYSWYGELIDADGSILVMAQEGRVFGHFIIDGEAYEIHDFGDQVNILLKINNQNFTEEECATENKSAVFPPSINSSELLNSTAIIRILVLFTSNAGHAIVNVSDMANLVVQQVRIAIALSNIPNVYVSLAGVNGIVFTEDPMGDIAKDAQILANHYYAKNQRNAYDADVVIMFTNGNYGNVYGRVTEVGPKINKAYGIVEVDASAAWYTFAHEVGHFFGARHDGDTNSIYAHGHIFNTGTWPFETTQRTILKRLLSGNVRIPYYSNPEVKIKKKYTGTAIADNARQIEEQAVTVAAFRDYTPPFTANITGPDSGNNTGIYNWAATVSNGTTPYSYNWESSTDGFNFIGIGTSQSITATMPFNQDLHLRLTVTDNNGEQDIDFHEVFNNSGTGCIICPFSVETVNDSSMWFNLIPAIHPNPSDQEINVLYSTEVSNAKVTFLIYDLSGKVVFSENHEVAQQGNFNKVIDISSLANGQYILKVQAGNKVKNNRLIINR